MRKITNLIPLALIFGLCILAGTTIGPRRDILGRAAGDGANTYGPPAGPYHACLPIVASLIEANKSLVVNAGELYSVVHPPASVQFPEDASLEEATLNFLRYAKLADSVKLYGPNSRNDAVLTMTALISAIRYGQGDRTPPTAEQRRVIEELSYLVGYYPLHREAALGWAMLSAQALGSAMQRGIDSCGAEPLRQLEPVERALYEILSEYTDQEISYYRLNERDGMPMIPGYHPYENRGDLFFVGEQGASVVDRLFQSLDRFFYVLNNPIPAREAAQIIDQILALAQQEQNRGAVDSTPPAPSADDTDDAPPTLSELSPPAQQNDGAPPLQDLTPRPTPQATAQPTATPTPTAKPKPKVTKPSATKNEKSKLPRAVPKQKK